MEQLLRFSNMLASYLHCLPIKVHNMRTSLSGQWITFDFDWLDWDCEMTIRFYLKDPKVELVSSPNATKSEEGNS